MDRRLLSKRQVAKIARVDASTVNLWLARGLLPAVPVSTKRVKVPAAALEALLRGENPAQSEGGRY